ncbi:MAG TPA: SDR family NAD(P)-dependent oxidoreductase [Microvirga sp.]|jgi:NAD(P)-dependent dehydrogenase (short-subunit alcohol dehydrogenase family)|nr:SDR family NAD(P)-dependent oxidoreductase [Microvirga sp.]
MPDLSGSVVAITGSTGHLGAALVERLGAAGACLVLLDRGRNAAVAASERVLTFGGLDLTDAAALSGALDQAKARFGRTDALVATVGGFEGGSPVHETGWDVWERMIGANLQTAVAACRAAVPHLLERGGRIVTVGARPALAGVAGLGAYGAAKAALVRLTESLAQELLDRGVTVNCVAPSIIDTPDNRAAMPKADHAAWVPPEDLAAVIQFLLSDGARSISGATIPVYGRA